jgi:arylsulfatase A-like enzyme
MIYPRIEEQDISTNQVGLVDILPTVTSWLGVETPAGLDGRSLGVSGGPGMSGADATNGVYSETVYDIHAQDADSIETLTCYASLRVPPWKIIWNRLQDRYHLYNLDQDPGEKIDLADVQMDIVASLSEKLRELAQSMPIVKEATDKTLVDRLRALGYMQ